MTFFSIIYNNGIKYGMLMLCAFYIGSGSAYAKTECIDMDGQQEINRCLSKEVAHYNQELDTLYHALYKISTDTDKTRLKAARTAWEEFAKQQCAYNASATEGGTAHSMVLSTCYIDLVQQYITLLKEQLTCEEGDLACSLWR